MERKVKVLVEVGDYVVYQDKFGRLVLAEKTAGKSFRVPRFSDGTEMKRVLTSVLERLENGGNKDGYMLVRVLVTESELKAIARKLGYDDIVVSLSPGLASDLIEELVFKVFKEEVEK